MHNRQCNLSFVAIISTVSQHIHYNHSPFSSPIGKLFSLVTYWTANSSEVTDPSLATGWDKCFYHEEPMGKEFTIRCDESYDSIYMRQFAITVGNVNGIRLTLVEVYGIG